ncbi:MAG: hypothetical protein ACKV0T_22035 [Planctomycetales bacterium]
MSGTMTASAILDRTYLEVRCKLLEVAAIFDRIERGAESGQADNDPRLQQLRDAVAIVGGTDPDRAERLQMLFSDPYVPNWNRRSNTGANGTPGGRRS